MSNSEGQSYSSYRKINITYKSVKCPETHTKVKTNTGPVHIFILFSSGLERGTGNCPEKHTK